jgi:hypothetical protein
MPRGPKGEKRPADVIGNAVHVMRVLIGEIEDTIPNDGKDPAAKALGKKSGTARAKSMTPKRRAEVAKKAAERWKDRGQSPSKQVLLGTENPLNIGLVLLSGIGDLSNTQRLTKLGPKCFDADIGQELMQFFPTLAAGRA